MYTLIIFLIMVFIPIPAMMRYMLTGRNAYRGILEGSLSAMTGVALVFMAFWTMTGATFFDVMNSALSQITVKDMDLSGYYMPGMKTLEPGAMQQAFESAKETSMLAFPGTLIILCLIIAYLNYGTISWILSKTGRKISTLPPIRAFSLPRNVILGTLLIYILSYIAVNLGIIDKNLMMISLGLLFTFVFSIQGLAVVFFFGYVKKIPKFVLVIISAVFMLTQLGQTFLSMLGLIDIILNIRKRFYQTNLKI